MAVLESHEDERLQTMAMARQREVVWRQQNMELLDRYQVRQRERWRER